MLPQAILPFTGWNAWVGTDRVTPRSYAVRIWIMKAAKWTNNTKRPAATPTPRSCPVGNPGVEPTAYLVQFIKNMHRTDATTWMCMAMTIG